MGLGDQNTSIPLLYSMALTHQSACYTSYWTCCLSLGNPLLLYNIVIGILITAETPSIRGRLWTVVRRDGWLQFESSIIHSYRPGSGMSFTGSKLYLSMNFFCWTRSASAKNSSISWAQGMLSELWLKEVSGVSLVAELGVLKTSVFVIKLRGVVSLASLQQRDGTPLYIQNSISFSSTEKTITSEIQNKVTWAS